MFSKNRVLLFGLIVMQGMNLVGSEKPKSPRNVENLQLNCSAELRKKINSTVAITIANQKSNTQNVYHHYCGHSPVDTWIPYDHSSGVRYSSDCP